MKGNGRTKSQPELLKKYIHARQDRYDSLVRRRWQSMSMAENNEKKKHFTVQFKAKFNRLSIAAD